MAPADMILLDSNNIRDKLPICYINILRTEGKESLREVKSSNLTRSTTRAWTCIHSFISPLPSSTVSQVKDSKKSHFNKYKTRLNLKLVYETPHGEINSFFGQLRLKKDPKIEELSYENFIPRGSQIIVNKEKDW